MGSVFLIMRCARCAVVVQQLCAAIVQHCVCVYTTDLNAPRDVVQRLFSSSARKFGTRSLGFRRSRGRSVASFTFSLSFLSSVAGRSEAPPAHALAHPQRLPPCTNPPHFRQSLHMLLSITSFRHSLHMFLSTSCLPRLDDFR